MSSSQKRPKKDFLLALHQKSQVLSDADRIKQAGDTQIALDNMKMCRQIHERLKDLIKRVKNRKGDDIDDEDESPTDKINKFKT